MYKLKEITSTNFPDRKDDIVAAIVTGFEGKASCSKALSTPAHFHLSHRKSKSALAVNQDTSHAIPCGPALGASND
jgi:hypothetical protein